MKYHLTSMLYRMNMRNTELGDMAFTELLIRYVSQKCAEILEEDVKDLKIITCHLGNGASIAGSNGISGYFYGFTPLERTY